MGSSREAYYDYIDSLESEVGYEPFESVVELEEQVELLKFRLCTTKTIKGKRVVYECYYGFWEVEGSLDCIGLVRSEALRYFLQYLEDGEYDTIFDKEY